MSGKEWTIPSAKKNKDVLLVFLRAPELGRVKTRLAKDVGGQKALDFYKSFVGASLSAASAWKDQAQDREVWISFYPGEKKDLVRDWLGREYFYLAQSGADLGHRMASAMAEAFDRGAQKTIVLGTDIPQVRGDHIEQAFAGLDSSHVVVGPSLDGGYWLIGASRNRFTPNLFKGMNWGTSSVFADTIARCRENNLAWAELAVLQDVDTLADLESIEASSAVLRASYEIK